MLKSEIIKAVKQITARPGEDRYHIYFLKDGNIGFSAPNEKALQATLRKMMGKEKNDDPTVVKAFKELVAKKKTWIVIEWLTPINIKKYKGKKVQIGLHIDK